MKYSIKKIIVPSLVGLLMACSVTQPAWSGNRKKKSSSKVNNQQPLSQLLDDISDLDRNQTAHVLESVQEATTRIEKAVKKSTKELKKAVERKIEKLDTVAREESEKIVQRSANEAELMKQESHKKSIELKQHAAQTILQLVARAEEEALRAKLKARQEFMKKKIDAFAHDTASQEPEESQWKDALREEFLSALHYLQDIIMQGESATEASDFADHFDEQEQWFEDTLASTQDPSDASYEQLVQKKSALAHIAQAVHSAESMLAAHFSHLSQQSSFYRQLRLALLYEINAVMQQKSGDGAGAIAATTLSDHDVATIFNNVLGSLQQPSAPSEPSLKPPADTATIIAQATAQQIKYALVPQLELLNKDHLELYSIIMDTNQRLDHFREQEQRSIQETASRIDATENGITDIKTMITTQGRKHVDMVNRSQLSEELSDRRFSEGVRHLDTIKTLLQEQMQQQGQSLDKISYEQQAWVDRFSQQVNHLQGVTQDRLADDAERINRVALEDELMEKMVGGAR